MKLKQQIFRGSLWILIGNGGQQAVSFFLFIYLARLLDPGDFGVMAFAAVVLDFVIAGGRYGQIETLQRLPSIDQALCSTSFWLSQAFGFALMAAIVLVAQPLAGIASMPKLASVLYLLAPVALIQNLGSVHESKLKREFKYGAIAVRNVLSTACGGIVAVWLARAGYGVYALAVQRIVFATVLTATMWVAYRWKPSFTFDKASARIVSQSGRQIAFTTVVGMANPRIVDSAVGIFLGAYWLGYLKLAWRAFDFISQLAVQPLSTVALSTFSRLQHDREALTRAYLRMTQMVALVLLPIFAGLAVLAPEFVPLVFGAKWQPSVILLQLFAVMSIVAPINYFFAPTMNAIGESRVVMRQVMAQLVLTVVLTAITAQWGIVAVVAAHVLRSFIMTYFTLTALQRCVGLAPSFVLRRLLPICTSIVGMILIMLTIKMLLPLQGWLWLIVGALSGAAAYAGLLLAGDGLRLWHGYVRQLLVTIAEAAGRPPAKKA